MWGFAGHTLIFGDLLICPGGGEGSTWVALECRTGQEKWHALSSKQTGVLSLMPIQQGSATQRNSLSDMAQRSPPS